MQHAEPRRFSRRRVEQLLSKTKSFHSVGNRIAILSRQFLGLPYDTHTLIGSADTPEVFTVSLKAFDCVTYMETVLALALANNADEFVQWLRKIRYENGRIQWKRRNHYMTEWIRSNVHAGALQRPALRGIDSVSKQRTLDDVPGLPPVSTHFTCVPRRALSKLIPHIQTGDLIFFASTRSYLDVFHCGILVRDGDRVLLRHAARSRGAVVEQDLNEFLKANRMAGLIIARPRS